MANLNEIKGTVFSALGVAAEKTRNFADKASDRAKDVSRITKLNFELKSAKDTIEKSYSEIGKIYYNIHRNNPEDYFIQLCEEVTSTNKRIDAIQSEIDRIKSRMDNDDDSIEVEFTEVSVDDEPVASESDFIKSEESEDKSGDGCDCGCNCN